VLVDPVSADALTVYIDSAIGGPNPGLGEVELIPE
jgi:hypothetical protein